MEGRKSKTIKEVKGAKRGEVTGSGFESPRPEPPQTMNPLELPVKNEHGQLYLPGNMALVSLSLACQLVQLRDSIGFYLCFLQTMT